MAAGGERVILIDSDVRRPTQHRLADRARAPGLSEYACSTRKSLDEVIQKSIAPNLDFIPSGHRRRIYPRAVASSAAEGPDRHAARALRQGRLRFAPRSVGVSDASVLASAVDGTVLLIQHRRNPQSMVVRVRNRSWRRSRPRCSARGTQPGAVEFRRRLQGYYTEQLFVMLQRGTRQAPAVVREAGKTPDRGGGDDKLVLNEPGDRPMERIGGRARDVPAWLEWGCGAPPRKDPRRGRWALQLPNRNENAGTETGPPTSYPLFGWKDRPRRSQNKLLTKPACALVLTPCFCGRSSVGRAPPCQGGRREFESLRPLHFE